MKKSEERKQQKISLHPLLCALFPFCEVNPVHAVPFADYETIDLKTVVNTDTSNETMNQAFPLMTA